MSKKLIAVAAAAALALTGLVGIPASATSLTLAADTSDGNSTSGIDSTTNAWTVAVPSQDVLRATTTTSRSVVTLTVTSLNKNATVNVSATGAVKLLTASQLSAATTTTATGTATLALTTNDSNVATFYAYNTSTTGGSVTVNEVAAGVVVGANTKWIKGKTAAANAYKVNLTAPTIAGLGSKVEYTATVVDMFGNALESISDLSHQVLGGDAGTLSGSGNLTWSTTKKIYEGSFTNRTTAGPTALLVSLGTSADSVKAFGDKVASVFVNVSGADLQAAITALQAEVAALKATVEKRVTKKRYNTLARKWNRAFPSQAVALKK